MNRSISRDHIGYLEAALLAGVHPQTLLAALHRRELAHERVGPRRRILIKIRDLFEWVERRSAAIRVDREETEER